MQYETVKQKAKHIPIIPLQRELNSLKLVQGRRNRCGRSGGRRTNVQHTNHKIKIKIIIIITVLRTLDSFTTRIWTGNETTYSTYLATYAHMDVTTFNMAETHFPAKQFRPTKGFCSPKRQFGCKGDQRSFYAERCDTLSWLHYTMSMQTLLSATLVCAARLYYMFANCNHTAA